MSQKKKRMGKQKATDLIPKSVKLAAQDIVFSCPTDSYEEKLRKINERIYSNPKQVVVLNPRHAVMALDEALKTF